MTVRRSSVSSSSWWGVVHNTPSDQAASTVASASGQRGSDRLHHWEAVQGLTAAAPASGSTRSGVTPTACAARGRSPDTGTAVEQRFLGRQTSSSINQSTVGLQSIRNNLSNAPNSPSSVPRLRGQRRSQTQITALGNLPNAVIGEP